MQRVGIIPAQPIKLTPKVKKERAPPTATDYTKSRPSLDNVEF